MTPSAARGCLYLLIFLAFVGVLVVAVPIVLASLGIAVAVPVITVYGEPYDPGTYFFGFSKWEFTNTAMALIVVDIIVIGIALALRNQVKSNMVPKGFHNFFELLVGGLYSVAKDTVGAVNAKRVFPLVATFFLVVLVANWTKLIPGYETVGLIHCAEDGYSSYPISNADTDPVPLEVLESEKEKPENRLEFPGVVWLKVDEPLDSGTKATEETYEACKYKYFGKVGEISEKYPEGKYKHAYEELVEAGHEEEADKLAVTPFLRGAATDLNFTLALALIAMFSVQFFGVNALGLGYFAKFINLPAVGNVNKRPMGVMDFVVGALEILSEFSKIISFAFRLFGVIFAGGILLIVIVFLASGVIPGLIYVLEIFIGAIQAFVFFILPLVLIKLAMISHSHDDHGDHGEGHGHGSDSHH